MFTVPIFFFKDNLVQFGCTLSHYTVTCIEQKKERHPPQECQVSQAGHPLALPLVRFTAAASESPTQRWVLHLGEGCHFLWLLVVCCDLVWRSNKQTLSIQRDSIEVLTPVERRKKDIKSFPMLQKPAEGEHPKETAPLAHTTHIPSHPVWPSPHGGLENLSGSGYGRACKVAPGFLQGSHCRGSREAPLEQRRRSSQYFDSNTFASFTQEKILHYDVTSI